MVSLDLSDQELSQLEEFERSREGDRKWLDFYTVEVMIDLWRSIAAEINQLNGNADDYAGAGLLWRKRLQEVLDATQPPLRTKLEAEIHAVDAEFRLATDEDVDQLLRNFLCVDDLDGWWWHRIPRSGPIRHYLDAAHVRIEPR
jgi:hypothetical protein